MDLKRLKQNLSDAGCSSETAGDIIRMYEVGNMESAMLLMRKDRCRLMEEMHKCGRKVDCLDILIRTTEQEIKQADH